MAGKLTALGSNCYIGSADVSGDIGALTGLEANIGMFEMTGLNKSAPERYVGRHDGQIGYAAFFNNDAGQSHLTFSALPKTDIEASVVIGTPALGSPMASMVAKQMNYALNVGNDGALAASVNLMANGYGLEWGEMLTVGKESFATGTVNGTSLDFGDTDSEFGCAVYLHVFSVASGTAVFKIQDSDDDSDFDDVTGLTFTGATGPTVQRLQTAADATIRQYVRVVGTGTHGAAVIAVNFVRYSETGPA